MGTIVLYAMMIPNIWTLEVIDKREDKSWKDKRFVVVANHASFIDSLVTSILPLKKKFMIGRVFTKFPVFGWLCLSSGHVPVDKNDPNNLQNLENSGVYRAKINMEKDKSSFMIYPEGMRTLKPYELNKFKTGAFYLAGQTDVPILPITLHGTAEAMPVGGLVDFAHITIVIGEPFYVENVTESIEKVRSFILENLDLITTNKE